MRVAASLLDDHFVKVTVTDEGPGVPAAASRLSKIFRVPGLQRQAIRHVVAGAAGNGGAAAARLDRWSCSGCRRRRAPARRAAIASRGTALAAASQAAFDRARSDASYAWDASPVTTARLTLEIWNAIQREDWSLVSQLNPVSGWPLRLWTFDKPYQFIGGSGGAGIGYTAPAAVGAALANKRHGRLSVCIQTDGDLMYAPGILWTSAHHRIPLLSVMHNNRAYHQETMHIQRMSNRHNRGVDRAHIGTTIDEPAIDYAKLAQSMGVWAAGPITDPSDLAPALARAVAIVKQGEPAIVDVVTQPR